MDRVEQSKQRYAELFWNTDVSASGTDPDFADILNHFVYGDVYSHGNLNDKQRELIALVVLAANHTLTQLRVHVGAALNVGLTPVEIKEAIYHCAPYIGFPKALILYVSPHKQKARGIPACELQLAGWQATVASRVNVKQLPHRAGLARRL